MSDNGAHEEDPHIEYDDFLVRMVSDRDGRFLVTVFSSVGEGTGSFSLPLAVAEWVSAHRNVSEGDTPQSLTPKGIGETLFLTLFSGPIRSLWEQSLSRAASGNRALRLQLQFEVGSQVILHNLPWELLCQPDTGEFLALSRLTPVVRSLAVVPLVYPVLLQPLRILVVGASSKRMAFLDFDQELKEIKTAWGSNSEVEVVVLAEAQAESLRETLLKTPFHVLHFIGHGGYDPSTGQGRLYFSDREGAPEVVSGEVLATILRDNKALRLVCLNASESARGKVATSLILAGIPVVVAMQSPISDKAAITFSRAMYRRLAAGDPIELAVTQGRQAIHALGPETMDWASPVLFTRSSGSQLFEKPRTFQIVGQGAGASNDKVAAEDRLGFLHYITAFSDLIESTYTQLPLTVGIFGSWGMGKSFLLEHIEKELNNRQGKRHHRSGSVRYPKAATAYRIHIVTFNAWEYSANEAIWPGLVRKIMDRLENAVSWPFPGRFMTKFWLNLKAQFRKERIRIGVVLYLASIAAVSAFLLWSGKLPQAWKALVAAGVAGLAGGLLKLVSDTVANPLSQWLTKLFLDDDYGRHIGQLARIRKDLEFLESRLRTDPDKVERVLILIDDLDRCEPDKAVEMLQAVKLLLDFESFILFLGIDARIITRAIEKHYQGLLGEAGASGYEYLDKIVQIPFQIPTPAKDQVKEFLRYQLGDPRPATDEPAIGRAPSLFNAERIKDKSTDAPEVKKSTAAPVVAPEALREKASGDLSAFTYEELQVFQGIADCLRPNPRHLKRLVNVYRLVRTLADLAGERILLEKPGATICWVVLCAQWPRMAHEMLQRLDELDSQRETNEDFRFLEKDPLRYLLAEVERVVTVRPPQIQDLEFALLHRLVDCNEARMSWEELRSIRRYTISFNPAIEVESSTEAR